MTRRREGVVTASKSSLSCRQFNEGEPHPATFLKFGTPISLTVAISGSQTRLLGQIDGYTVGLYHELHPKNNWRLHLNPEPMATSKAGC